ncbi:MAG: hypothetical protein IKS83_05610 [Victivallales bacterium]|nr:hypothetical protein [Victivallales bacterium]
MFSKIVDHLKNGEFQLGMLWAVILLLVAYGIVKVILLVRKSCGKIIIKDEGGNFVITRSAFRNFLSGVFKDVPGVDLNNVQMTKWKGEQIKVDLYLDAEPDADVIKLRDSLRNVVLRETAEKLGISSQIGELNLVIKSLPPSDELKN